VAPLAWPRWQAARLPPAAAVDCPVRRRPRREAERGGAAMGGGEVLLIGSLVAAAVGLAAYLYAGPPPALPALPGVFELLGPTGLLAGLFLLGLGLLLARRRRR
jgi:hypothetical protein